MRVWLLVLALALACSSSEGAGASPEPTAEATGDDSPEPEAQAETANAEQAVELPAPELNAGEQTLDAARGFDEGCASDADCVIATDPCARAFAVHRDRQEAFHAQFAGRRYRCAMHEYPSDPVAHCRESRCVGVVP